MKKELIIQNLCSAFEVIKDSWETRKESICKCITGMVRYDPNIAMDMWLYILNSHKDSLRTEDGSRTYIDSVCRCLYNDIGDSSDSESAKAVYKSIFNNHGLYSILFGDACFSNNFSYQHDFCEHCLKWYLTEKKPDNLMDVLKCLNSNNNFVDYTVGLVITRAINHLNEEIKISPKSQEILLSCIEFINDPNDRAEITIAALSAK